MSSIFMGGKATNTFGMPMSSNEQSKFEYKFIIIVLSLLFIFRVSQNLNADGGILSNKICIRWDNNLECMGYWLPYRGHTLAEYLTDMELNMSEKERYEAAELLKVHQATVTGMLEKTPGVMEWIFGKLLKFSGYGNNVENDIEKNHEPKIRKKEVHTVYNNLPIVWGKSIRYSDRLMLYMVLHLLDEAGSQEYPHITPAEFNRMAHSLYSLANEIYFDYRPDFTKLTTNPSVSLTYCQKNHGVVSCLYYDTSVEAHYKLFVTLLMATIENDLQLSRHWRSLETTDWILRHVPEMAEEGARVLELGAGKGYQAKLFKLRGIDIKATDISVPDFTIEQIEQLSASDAVHKYAVERPVIFVEYFSWDITQVIKELSRLPIKWTFVMITNGDAIKMTDYPDLLSLETYCDKEVLAPSVHIYESDLSETTLFVYRKLVEYPLEIVPTRSLSKEL